MAILINILEEIVANHAKHIMEGMKRSVAKQIQPRDIIAHSLNRLPPMYATSNKGLTELRNRAINELSQQINQTLQRAIQRVLIGDPLYNPTPLPDSLFQDSASVLDRFCKLFNREYMGWSDVAIATQAAILRNYSTPLEDIQELTQIQASGHSPANPRTRAEVAGIKSYLRRVKVKQIFAQAQTEEDQTIIQGMDESWQELTAQSYSLMIAYDEQIHYLLRPRLRIVNVMEQLVSHALQNFSNVKIHEGNRPNEITAYALNRLPPLYATSINGYNISCKRGINELSKDILQTVRNGALKVLQYPANPASRPFITDFEGEAQMTLQTLRKLIDRQDIDMSNVFFLVQDFITRD